MNQPLPRGKRKLPPKIKMLLAIFITLVVTVFLTVLFLNLHAVIRGIGAKQLGKSVGGSLPSGAGEGPLAELERRDGIA